MSVNCDSETSSGYDIDGRLHTLLSFTCGQTALGSGAYARVYDGCDTKSGAPLAVKKTCAYMTGLPNPSAIREIGCLLLLRGRPGIADLLGVRCNIENCTVMTALPLLKSNLLNRSGTYSQKLPLELCRSVVADVCQALGQAHVHGITHRDVKPENIMFTASCTTEGDAEEYPRTVLIDWGLSRHSPTIRAVRSPYVVTRWYRAPEILLGFSNYGTSSDMWSLGVTLCEILTGKVLFPGRDQMHQLQLIFRRIGLPTKCNWCEAYTKLRRKTISFAGKTEKQIEDQNESSVEYQCFREGRLYVPNFDSETQDFLAQCVCLDPQKRMSAIQALKHPFLRKLLHRRRLPPPNRLEAMLTSQELYYAQGLKIISKVWKESSSNRKRLMNWMVLVHHHHHMRSLSLPTALHMVHARFCVLPAPSGDETAGVVAMSALLLSNCAYGNSRFDIQSASQLVSCTRTSLRKGLNYMLQATCLHGGPFKPTYLHFLDAAAENGVLYNRRVTVPSHDVLLPCMGVYTLARFFAESAAVYTDALFAIKPSEHACAALHAAALGYMVVLASSNSCDTKQTGTVHIPNSETLDKQTNISPMAVRSAVLPIQKLLGIPGPKAIDMVFKGSKEAFAQHDSNVLLKFVSTGTNATWLQTMLRYSESMVEKHFPQ